MKTKYHTRILSRIAADLQREVIRTNNKIAKNDLEEQIAALKEFKKEIDNFRIIKDILNEKTTRNHI